MTHLGQQENSRKGGLEAGCRPIRSVPAEGEWQGVGRYGCAKLGRGLTTSQRPGSVVTESCRLLQPSASKRSHDSGQLVSLVDASQRCSESPELGLGPSTTLDEV